MPENRQPTQERLGIENHHAWICPCGNTEHSQGFHSWNREKKLYDLTCTSNFFRCDRCGRVIDSETGNIVEIAPV